jgi:hypothetical protein
MNEKEDSFQTWTAAGNILNNPPVWGIRHFLCKKLACYEMLYKVLDFDTR